MFMFCCYSSVSDMESSTETATGNEITANDESANSAADSIVNKSDELLSQFVNGASGNDITFLMIKVGLVTIKNMQIVNFYDIID